MSEPKKPRPSPLVVAGQLSAVAFEFTGTIAAGVIIGWFADARFGTEPWLLIVFALLGTSAGFWRMIVMARHFSRRP